HSFLVIISTCLFSIFLSHYFCSSFHIFFCLFILYCSSSFFLLTGDDYSVQVNLSDYLDILCPHYPADHPSSGPVDTLALYLVAEGQFRGCVETKEAIKRWECNQPYAPYGPVRFSEKIQRFTPFSLGFEFLPGHHYYYSCNLTLNRLSFFCFWLRPCPLCSKKEGKMVCGHKIT
uniref:Ephrin-A4-like n=1 Tax=Sinocyclocheilus grahami TaxID=75366 RepID=A0A672KUI4_SINGR